MDDSSRQAKAEELLAFLDQNAQKLRTNIPSLSAVREAVDFILEQEGEWPNDLSPDNFSKIMIQRYPELRFEWTGNIESEAQQDEPATDRQIAYLKVLEVPTEGYLTVRKAADLIDQYKKRISEGQKRRLDFYRLSYSPDITREEATRLIDAHKSEYPESEAAYQAWKASQGIA